jgi:ferredoxin
VTGVLLDRDVCFGSGECTLLAPDLFVISEDGAAMMTDPSASIAESLAGELVERCPSGAIQLREGQALPGEAPAMQDRVQGE